MKQNNTICQKKETENRPLSPSEEGAVNGVVKIDIGGGNVISSSITMNAIRELQLEVGKTAYAVIKASSVMIGIDD